MAVITLEELERQFGRLAVVVSDLSPVTAVGGQMYLSEVKDRFNKSVGPDGRPWVPLRFPRPQGGSKPLRNTGLLLASYSAFSTATSFGVGTNAKQARLLHYGGTVRPVRAKALTIPLTKEAVRSGGARNMPGLFVLRNKKTGKSFLASKTPSGRPRLHWLLTDHVKIPPRPQVGISQDLMDRFRRLLVTYLLTGRIQ